MTWYLTVSTTNGNHQITLSGGEEEAVEALKEAQANIGMNGTVTIANRLSVKAEDITSVNIHEGWP